jgi:two-component system phosphate regulon response regulator OmpR
MAARLVVVDDEQDLRVMIAEYLANHGYAVCGVGNGRELDAQLAHELPDLLILDVNMPGEDGFAIARRIRAQHAVPILMLTAADTVADRVVGLEIGAEDYLTKPFDLRELLARVRVILRRAPQRAAPTAPAKPSEARADPVSKVQASKVQFGRMLLDLDAHQLVTSEGAELALTTPEFNLLAAFARHPNRVLSREQLLELAHDRAGEVLDRSIDIRIARIRRKVEQDPENPQMIKTVRGAGYIFVPAKP